MVEDKVRKFIIDELHYDGKRDLPEDYPLIDNHVVDSLGIFQIVTWLESEYGIEVLDEELIPEYFGTIAGIARLVESKRRG